MVTQNTFNFMLGYILILSAVTLFALALGIIADQQRDKAQKDANEWKKMYHAEKYNREKLIAKISVLRLHISEQNAAGKKGDTEGCNCQK